MDVRKLRIRRGVDWYHEISFAKYLLDRRRANWINTCGVDGLNLHPFLELRHKSSLLSILSHYRAGATLYQVKPDWRAQREHSCSLNLGRNRRAFRDDHARLRDSSRVGGKQAIWCDTRKLRRLDRPEKLLKSRRKITAYEEFDRNSSAAAQFLDEGNSCLPDASWIDDFQVLASVESVDF